MNLEDDVSKGEILDINREYKGSVMYDAEIETALSRGKGKSVYTKLALLWRAMLVGHPFSDGNKRTALTVTALLLERRGLKVSDEIMVRVTNSLEKVAEENMNDVKRIERLVRYAVEGD